MVEGDVMHASWLFERIAQFKDDLSLVFRGSATTYATLEQRIHFWAEELTRQEIGAGNVVVIDGGFSPNAIGLLLALILAEAVVVPLTPLSRVQRPQFEAIVEAQFSFEFDEQDRWTLTRHGRVVGHALTKKLIGMGHPGLVIFSSGSTGEPKAILHDFVPLLDKFKRPGVRKTTLSFLLFDHIGGMDTLFNSIANGGTLVTTASRDAEAVCKAIEEFKVHTLPTSPTFLNLLLISEVWKNYDLSSLQVVAYGTEPMPESTLSRLRDAFPNVKFVQTYGMSELGVLRTRSREAGSLWMKFSGEGFETKIVDGVLWVRTPTAMLGYINAPDLFDEEGWLNTEDAVEVDGEYVRILGRVSDLINVGGQKVYPAEVENVIMTMDNVRDVAVFGERSPLVGNLLVARVNLTEPEPFDAFKHRLRTFCRDKLPNYKIPARIEVTNQEQFGHRLKKMRRMKADGDKERS